jgi:hypothetical protein
MCLCVLFEAEMASSRSSQAEQIYDPRKRSGETRAACASIGIVNSSATEAEEELLFDCNL